MNPVLREEIRDKLTNPSLEHGLSDSKWLQIAEKICRKWNGYTVEHILEEYDRQMSKVIDEIRR